MISFPDMVDLEWFQINVFYLMEKVENFDFCCILFYIFEYLLEMNEK